MTQRWFFDTEFHEDGRIIDLISIGMVGTLPSGAKVEFYAESNEFDDTICNDWVRANVFPKLQPSQFRLPREEIAKRLRTFVETHSPRCPGGNLDVEFWGYFADYDWVVLCQLFGRMVDLPRGWPQFCHDLRQVMSEHGITKGLLPQMSIEHAHGALYDANWTMDAYEAARKVLSLRALAEEESEWP